MENLFLEVDARKMLDGHSCPLWSSTAGWWHLAIGSQSGPGAPLALSPCLSLSQLPLGLPLLSQGHTEPGQDLGLSGLATLCLLLPS